VFLSLLLLILILLMVRLDGPGMRLKFVLMPLWIVDGYAAELQRARWGLSVSAPGVGASLVALPLTPRGPSPAHTHTPSVRPFPFNVWCLEVR
jgi:hypothetical protein